VSGLAVVRVAVCFESRDALLFEFGGWLARRAIAAHDGRSCDHPARGKGAGDTSPGKANSASIHRANTVTRQAAPRANNGASTLMGVEVIHASACQYTAVRYFCEGGTDAPVQQLLPRLVLVLTREPAAAYGFKEPPAKTFPERPHDPNGTISIDHIPRWRVAHRTSVTSADSRPSASHASSRGTAGHALRRVPGRGHWCGVSPARGWNSTSTSMPGAGIGPSCESAARRRCPALSIPAGCDIGTPVRRSKGDDPVDR